LELEGDPIGAHYHLATLIVTIEEETGDLCTIKEKLPSVQNAVVTTRQRTVFNLRNCQSKTG
jgi:hypothetical protein